jgi:plastocyanin
MVTSLMLLIFAGWVVPPGGGPFPPARATGKIAGKVILSTAVTSRKMRFRLYSDLGPAATPKASTAEGSEMANVVIYLDSVPGARRSVGRRTMVQRDETFEPHVVALERGGTVDFLNGDPFFHNVFSLSSPKTFDLGRYPQGQAKALQFDQPGIVKVFCHIHADMSAVIVVLDHPYFTSPDSLGRFELPNVPPGEYRVVAWHERAKAAVTQVRVVAGEAATVDFNIPVSHDVAARD